VAASAVELLALFEGLSTAVLVVERPSGLARLEGPRPPWLARLDLSEPLVTSLDPLDRDFFLELINCATPRPRAFQLGLVVKDVQLSVCGTSFLRADGQVLLALQDATAAKYDARQWRELESWLVTLGETLPFDFWIQDREGRYLLQNPASVRRMGFALGKTIAELDATADVRSTLQQSFERARAGEMVREEQSFLVNGTPAVFARTVSPLLDAGEVVGVLGVDIDITPLKQSAAALKHSLDELSTTQEALVRKKQLAAVGEMAAVVAHEVRNPLGSIANVVSLLQRGATSPAEARELFQIIADETRRLDLLVVSLLDFVRPSSLTLSPQPLGPIVERALQQTLWAENAGAQVRASVEGSVPLVLLEQSQLELAFTNLFRNAVQAMKGSGALEVRLSTEEREGGHWARVSIRDSGPGMPTEVQARIFEPFVTTRARGHGLGLAIVQKVVGQHRGEVFFEPATEGGTTCVVRLPLA
jgi:PAS domain S-box-containing protein